MVIGLCGPLNVRMTELYVELFICMCVCMNAVCIYIYLDKGVDLNVVQSLSSSMKYEFT